ncbi:diphosphomevalonate decarboxylase [uncultured Sunxiuqinia sp.]|uniref:diphosphomevalonate decarboxylase n=1 Tax=uncultured Sunxiuqinia sp. TaxID=1573825 RepID=UPI002AA72A6B|nr:diphosphomevalonate decarboxylase [uncultured Sunxiuqinia sp.]
MEEKEVYRASWECPSNIALVKYWGKKPAQLPVNPSLSFSLKNARTKTSVRMESAARRKVEFLFEGQPSSFAERVEKYLASMSLEHEWLNNFSFYIESKNTFPHSTGIASSASAFGALALCLVDLKQQANQRNFTEQQFFQKASRWARLGSGSACRSVFPSFALWGRFAGFADSTDCNAVAVQNRFHRDYRSLRDAVLLVDSSAKEVSSSAGHELMNQHDFKDARIVQANKNLKELLQVMKIGDHKRFFELIEKEALSLHAMMMTSDPSFILLHPNSLEIIRKIRQFRQQRGLSVGFTIDAGPNIHLIYFEKDKQAVHDFINSELLVHTQNKNWLDDCIGDGPIKLSDEEV